MNKFTVDKLIEDALAIESMSAKDAGALGFMARSLVLATMPHKNPGNVEAWGRKNGDFSLIMQPGFVLDKHNKPKSIGLPYGAKPRLVMAFIASEAIRTRSKEIALGKSLSEFMGQIGLAPTGGRWGTIPMLKDQMKRLFSSTVSFHYGDNTVDVSGGFKIASKTVLFWDVKHPQQTTLWESTVSLTDDFYREILDNPIPIDLRALSALKSSSLALDIYCWLTYRMSYLKKTTEIPWELLAAQFGSDYKHVRDFKKSFLKQSRKVLVVYDAKIEAGDRGLILRPTKTHIPKVIK